MARDFKDLNTTERTALVALVRLSVLADGAVSAEETSAFELLVQLLGEQGYRAAAEAATRRAADRQSLQALLKDVRDQEARELIYGLVLQVVTTDTVNDGERELLELVEHTWDITPQFDGFPSEEEDDAPESGASA